MWEVIHDADDTECSNVPSGDEASVHKDTAYTNITLGAHTDNTYWCDAAGYVGLLV